LNAGFLWDFIWCFPKFFALNLSFLLISITV
jgi:hypothetical protein